MPPIFATPSVLGRSSFVVLAPVLIVLSSLLGSALGQSLSQEVRRQVIPAVVMVVPLDDESLSPVGVAGSGTIISPDGYVLTNFHVAGDLDTRQPYHWHGIHMTTSLEFADQPPRLLYWAEYVAGDPTHDLALLKITEFADETPVPADHVFPSVKIGDSNSLLLGDPLTIVGYPGISGETITLTFGIMSGWLGEDWTAGGKQWIKTDAKIAHGNSGGAVFNLAGELVGVPTAGQTVQYDELDVEEQAYVRPISLAWALIGPNVTSINRGTQGQPEAQTQTQSQSQVQPPTTGGNASGDYGVLTSGEVVHRTIDPAVDAVNFIPTYHRYQVDVPSGATAVQVSVDSTSFDVDLAIRAGTPPDPNWNEVDHIDLDPTPSPSFRVEPPTPGPLYIDVINLVDAPATYQLTVVVVGGTPGASTGAQTEAMPPTSPALPPLEVGAAAPGIVGELAIGQQARGKLAGSDEGASYHTFTIEVPEGTQVLTLTMMANMDLDLAVKYGAEITAYGDEGDWFQRDISEAAEATLVIETPAAGTWFVDVFNLHGSSMVGTYTLDVR